jgi:hypothetical protein
MSMTKSSQAYQDYASQRDYDLEYREHAYLAERNYLEHLRSRLIEDLKLYGDHMMQSLDYQLKDYRIDTNNWRVTRIKLTETEAKLAALNGERNINK